MKISGLPIAFLVFCIATSYASLDNLNLDKPTVNSANGIHSSNHRRSLSSTQPSARVVNGWEAESGQFPYTGYVVTDQNCLTPTPSSYSRRLLDATTAGSPATERTTGICASSLIMPRVIVSAAHCLYKCSSSAPPDSLPGEIPTPQTEVVSWGGPITVKLNQLNISQPTWQSPGAEERVMSGATRHPGYIVKDDIPTENDVSLMWFDNASQITPAQLASQAQASFNLGQYFMVAGWGYTNPNKSSLSQTLLTAVVPYYPLALCMAKYNTLTPPIGVSKGDICAGSDPGTNYADTCSGDSGGPLLMNVTTSLNRTATMRQCVGCVPQQLVGVTSYGEGCANTYPGVYTNIPKQADWIDQTITLSNAGGIEPPAIGCSSHVGQRYYGRSNCTLMNIPNAAQCCNACKVNGTASCRSWTWHKSTKRCILIKKVEQRVLASTWTSGNVTGTLASKSSTCELEFYVQYTDPGHTQFIKKITSGSASQSAQSCCSACQQNTICRNMSYNVVLKTCTLFKGPSKKAGWGRVAWQYNYISGLVSRRS